MAIPATFCVIAGEGVFTLEEEVFNAKSGDMVECPADAIRGWRNEGSGDLHLLVIKHSGTQK